jgi:hypothetical protein
MTYKNSTDEMLLAWNKLENFVNSAIEDDKNFNKNGAINWDHIHADAYENARKFFNDDQTFNRTFDDIVDGVYYKMDETLIEGWAETLLGEKIKKLP